MAQTLFTSVPTDRLFTRDGVATVTRYNRQSDYNIMEHDKKRQVPVMTTNIFLSEVFDICQRMNVNLARAIQRNIGYPVALWLHLQSAPAFDVNSDIEDIDSYVS